MTKGEFSGGLDQLQSMKSANSSTESAATMKDWQASRKIRKRTRYVLENLDTIPMDVCFRVGRNGKTEDIFAHKFMLSIGNPAFLATFYKNTEESKNFIHVPDVAPQAFRVMLTYLYTEEAENLTMDLVMQTLYCAKVFGVPKLADDCRDYVQDNLSTENCCSVYSEATATNEVSITQLAAAIICSRTAEVVQTPDFLKLSDLMLGKFLQMDELALDEYSIYLAVRRWMYHNLGTADKQSFHIMFTSFMIYLRLPLLEAEEQAEGPDKSGLREVQFLQDGVLTAEELNSLFRYRFAKIKPEIKFPTLPRTPKQKSFFVTFRLFAVVLDLYSDEDDYEDDMDIEQTTIPFGTVVLEIRADLLPATCRRFRQQVEHGDVLSIAYGGETFDRDADEVQGMEEDERIGVENRLLRPTAGTIAYIRDEGEQEACAGELVILHADKEVNRHGKGCLVFGRVVVGLEVLDQALKFDDHLGDDAYPLNGIMPRVEFYFGGCRVLETWTAASGTGGLAVEEPSPDRDWDEETISSRGTPSTVMDLENSSVTD